MMDLITLYLVPALIGAVICMILCTVCRHKRPSFWLAPFSAVSTGIILFLCFYGGRSMFTGNFWEGFNDAKTPGLVLLLLDCGFFGIISFFASVGVIAIYRSRQR